MAHDGQGDDEQQRQDAFPEQTALHAPVVAQFPLRSRAGSLVHAVTLTFPVFTVLSHVAAVPRASATYAANVIAHNNGP